jgi:hypothetical protein
MDATTSTDSDWDVLALFGKAYQVYFSTDPSSWIYLIRFFCSNYFCTKTFSVNGAASPYFGPMAHVSSWVHLGRVLGLENDPNTLVVVLPSTYMPLGPPQTD